MFAYNDKIAFVTGALGIIGRTYTKYLLQNDLKGIALIDIQKHDGTYQKELETKYGKNKCIFLQADVCNKTELKNALEATVKHFEQLDIVINNAGICNEENYELTLNINFMGTVHGTMLAMREYLPKYKKGPGVIVNTSSIAGVFTPPNIPVYSLSKHAVVAIGMCYAKEAPCLDQDIRVLTVCPGPIKSNVMVNALSYNPVGETSIDNQPYPIAQSADFLGEGMINMINEGANGAVWMFMVGKEPCKVDYQPNQNIAVGYLFDK